jgi:glycosyltransferase involved in cell wall biosynthesis
MVPVIDRKTRILAVFPRGDSSVSMPPFLRKQVSSLEGVVTIRRFYLAASAMPWVLFGEWRRFRKEIAEFDPQVIHAHYGTATGFFAAFGCARPVVISFRGSDINPDPGVGWLRRAVSLLFSELSVLRAAALICVSRGLQRRLWWRRPEVRIIPTGVDLACFYVIPKHEAQRRLGWDPTESVVLFAGRAEARVKRLDLAEAAMEVVTRHVPGVRFHVLAGHTPHEDMVFYYNAADCFLMTSDYEGSPNVIKEALACNLPVVSVDVGDVRERLDGVAPSRICSRSPESLATAIIEVLGAGKRSNGREMIAEISEARVVEMICGVYRELIAEQFTRCRPHRCLPGI